MISHGRNIATRLGLSATFYACLACLVIPATDRPAWPQAYTPPPPPPPPPNFSQQHMQTINRIQQQTTTNMSNQQMTQQRMQQQSSQTQQQQHNQNLRDSESTRRDLDKATRATLPSAGNAVAKNGGNAFIETTEVVVSTVETNTQGARLGLKKGDILVSYNGNLLQSTQQVQNLVKFHANNGTTSSHHSQQPDAHLRRYPPPWRNYAKSGPAK